MQKRRFVPSPAMVVSLIALFVALGGTSYAAITSLPAGSVGTAQLKNSAVTSAKIKNGAITAAKISSSAAGAAKVVGGAGAPAYQGPWQGAIGVDEGLSFYKDPFGIVHLQGNAETSIGTDNGTIFTLPPGYRPAGTLYFSVYGAGGSAEYIQVDASGNVILFSAQGYVGLTNITFRAGL